MKGDSWIGLWSFYVLILFTVAYHARRTESMKIIKDLFSVAIVSYASHGAIVKGIQAFKE